MPCYHPLKGFVVGRTDAGKRKIKVTSYDVNHLERIDEEHPWICVPDEHTVYSDVVFPSFDIPCGKCIGCRLDYSRSWAARCLLEIKEHDSNYFVTLTYDDNHLPLSMGTLPDTGEMVTTATLVKSDFQKFMKRLRKAADEKIRFFACGEYGDRTARPHYHAILFGLHLDDLRFYKRVGDFNYYTSEWLSKIWPFGFVVVGEACFETAAYVARYVTKKLNGAAAEKYEQLGIIPEFCLMSRRPGIAAGYVEEKGLSLLDDEYIFVGTDKGAKKFRPPKYFKRRFDSFFEDTDIVYCVKQDADSEASIRLMESIKRLQSDQTDVSYLEMLAAQEAVQKAKMRGLERSL